jgi:SAM-dependent methyltransferase
LNSYNPKHFWEQTHSEVPTERAGKGEGIRSVGGGSCVTEALYLYRLRTIAMRRAVSAAQKNGMRNDAVRALEFGCGSGYWLQALPSLLGTTDFTYTGADISETAIARLEKNYPRQSFVCLHDPAIGWQKIATRAPFDLTLAIDVLYHITDYNVWRSSLRQLSANTAPGGFLIFSDYGYTEPKANPSSTHVKHRSAQEYLDELENNALDVLAVVPKFYFFNRIKYGPWRDHGIALAAVWRLADKYRFAMHMLYLADCLLPRLTRPMNPRCKTRFFVCRKRANPSDRA